MLDEKELDMSMSFLILFSLSKSTLNIFENNYFSLFIFILNTKLNNFEICNFKLI